MTTRPKAARFFLRRVDRQAPPAAQPGSDLPFDTQGDGFGNVDFRSPGPDQAAAVAQPHRGTGVGSELLQAVIGQVANAGGRVLWCNARTVALPFYQRHGFVVIGDEFLAAHGIPHHQMWRPVAASLPQR